MSFRLYRPSFWEVYDAPAYLELARTWEYKEMEQCLSSLGVPMEGAVSYKAYKETIEKQYVRLKGRTIGGNLRYSWKGDREKFSGKVSPEL